MDIGKDLQEAYEQGRRDALNELMEYTYGMLTAEKFGLQHKIKSMMDTADTPQTEPMKTADYCDICNHKGCDNCIADANNPYCVPSGYATQTETQNSNLTFEKDECAKEYEELGLKELKELINADRKTEPQTCDHSCVQTEVGCGHEDCQWK